MTVRRNALAGLVALPLLCAPLGAQDAIDLLEMELRDLASMVTSASLVPQGILDAPSNIVVISGETVRQRGYLTLTELAQDLPGFDFLVYEDGGGEYPTFNRNRGLGDIGNDKLLVLVDGITQNFVSYNWSTQWTFEALLQDLDRVEIIQGPGSSLYGAQAFSGVIHFITNRSREGAEIRTLVGPDNTRGLEAAWGRSLAARGHVTVAVRSWESDGDGGARYDPGGYWHDNIEPDRLLADYARDGTRVQDAPNPRAGEPLQEGFETHASTQAVRANLRWGRTEVGGYHWRTERGMGSYITGFEYQARDPSYEGGHAGGHLYLSDRRSIGEPMELESSAVYRTTQTLPSTGFRYVYQYPDLTKSYRSKDHQVYVEERLTLRPSSRQDVVLGARVMWSEKTDRIVALDDQRADYEGTTSSWDIAGAGLGLYIPERVTMESVREQALYGLWSTRWGQRWSTSIGLRFDHSAEFGSVLNPRLGVIYKPYQERLTLKMLFGTAFRQPSIFELRSEFRGNENLTPEEISTYELEARSLVTQAVHLKANLFYSVVTDFVGRVEDLSKPALERFENLDGETLVRGASLEADVSVDEQTRVTANYMFTQGRSDDSNWDTIPQTARSKVNVIVHRTSVLRQVNLTLRVNYVGPRRVQATNAWLLANEGRDAPPYAKATVVGSYTGIDGIELQLIVRNLLDTDYYGVARESGNSNVDDYDAATKANPNGFIPAYHPQPGRTAFLRAVFEF
jgi:outer membrane receptor for ferrienterochelin and colicins